MKTNFILFLLCVGIAASTPGYGDPQEKQDQRPIIEEVTVTNVEVPVRVMYKGEPVLNLKKSDFTVYDNNHKVEINGLFLKRKKITVPYDSEKIESPVITSTTPRTFVLVFSITDFNEYLVKAIDHLFANVLKPSDHLLILANEKTIDYPKIINSKTITAELIENLKNESMNARRRLIDYIRQIETHLQMHDFKVNLSRLDERPQRLVEFLKKYLMTWRDYKYNYLTPRTDRFYYFSRYLEKVKGEKWVISFYQFDLFPQIRMTSDTMDKINELTIELLSSNNVTQKAFGRTANMILNQIGFEFNSPPDSNVKEISRLFYKVDATFHSFFIKSTGKTSVSDMEYQEVASDIEESLKAISSLTGGVNITSNDLVKSIDTVSEREDAYYVLTYVPYDKKSKGKIKIHVDGNYDVFFDDNYRAEYIADYFTKLNQKLQTLNIKITDFMFSNNSLSFTVKDYRIQDIDGTPVGKIKIRVRFLDGEGNPIFTQEKALTTQKIDVKVQLGGFKKVSPGEYVCVIDAVDFLTGNQSNVYDIITLSETPR